MSAPVLGLFNKKPHIKNRIAGPGCALKGRREGAKGNRTESASDTGAQSRRREMNIFGTCETENPTSIRAAVNHCLQGLLFPLKFGLGLFSRSSCVVTNGYPFRAMVYVGARLFPMGPFEGSICLTNRPAKLSKFEAELGLRESDRFSETSRAERLWSPEGPALCLWAPLVVFNFWFPFFDQPQEGCLPKSHTHTHRLFRWFLF